MLYFLNWIISKSFSSLHVYDLHWGIVRLVKAVDRKITHMKVSHSMSIVNLLGDCKLDGVPKHSHTKKSFSFLWFLYENDSDLW